MPPRPQHGYLLLVDISGFTPFVAKTAIEHAQEVIRDLLELIVNKMTPPLTLLELEGDAVYMYAPSSRLARGETFLELIETTYVAFKDRIQAMRRRTSCECNACRTIPNLDLKFVAHHAEYIIEAVAGVKKPFGRDVNLVHRLLKNKVTESTGWRAYALFTEKCVVRLDLQLEEAHRGSESHEHIGETTTFTIDLSSRYREILEARRVFISSEEADYSFTIDIAAPPPIVWEWLNDPVKREQWHGGKISAVLRPGGRTKIGARNHCAHGKFVIKELIVDWKPFEYFTWETSTAVVESVATSHLISSPEGTRLHFNSKLRRFLFFVPDFLKIPLYRLLYGSVFRIKSRFEGLARKIEEEAARSVSFELEAKPE